MNLFNNFANQLELEWDTCKRETSNLCDRFNLPRDTFFKATFSGAASSLATLLAYTMEGAAGFGGMACLPAVVGFASIAVLAALTYAVAVAILRKCNYATIPWPIHFLLGVVCITAASFLTSLVIPQLIFTGVLDIILIATLALINTFANISFTNAPRCPLNQCSIFVV